MWRELFNASPLLGKWIVCKMDNVRKLRIGKDHWLGFKGQYVLSKEFIKSLMH